MPVRRGVEVTGVTQDDDGVDVHLAGGEPLRTAYLVGADGGRSVVRRAAGIELVGGDADPQPPDRRGRGDRGDARRASGSTRSASTGSTSMADGRTVRVVVTEQAARARRGADAWRISARR